MRHDAFDDGEGDAGLSGAATADLLRRLAPVPAAAGREAIAFEAGRRAGRRSLTAYRATTALLAVALIGTGLAPRGDGGGGAGTAGPGEVAVNPAAPGADARRRVADVAPVPPAPADAGDAPTPLAAYAVAARLQERLIDEGLSALPRVRAVPLASPAEAERFERQLRNGGGL